MPGRKKRAQRTLKQKLRGKAVDPKVRAQEAAADATGLSSGASPFGIPVLKDTKARVDYIRGRMAVGDWLGGYTMRVQIAAAWGLSEERIKQLAAEASRALQLSPEELAEQKQVHAAYCERIMMQAAAIPNQVTGLPDWRAALEAGRDAAKFKGIDFEGPKRVELTGKGGAPIQAPVIMIPPEVDE